MARGVLADLDLDAVLRRVLDAARELSGARYAAIGVLDSSGRELARFLTSGVDAETYRRIGSLPRGRGVLGVLISDPVPLRVTDIGAHPSSYGFPPGHPQMRSFLGVPVFVAGKPWGNLYVTEKAAGDPFTEQDERAIVMLADLAGVAINHATRYEQIDAQRVELQRNVGALDATVQIARAVGGETDLDVILGLVAKRGRALVSARAVVIEHQRGSKMVIAAGAGELPPELIGRAVDLRDSVASAALRTERTLRLEDEPNRARFERHGLGRLGFHAQTGLVVPLVFRGRGMGVLIAVDRLVDGPGFSTEDQRLLEAFAASAATAVATASSVQAERQRQRMAAAEQERARWARELHDETLQNLAAMRFGITAQLRAGNPETMMQAMHDTVAQIDAEIKCLRSLITDLRPAALDELGVEAALGGLAERSLAAGVEVELDIDLGYEQGRTSDRLTPELETALYRISQEALTNARKHGGATRAIVEMREEDQFIRVTVRDNGAGFDPQERTSGFGLLGMRERAEMLGGTLTLDSSPGNGTTVTATLPTGSALAARAS